MSILCESTDKTWPDVYVRECLFATGQTGIAMIGAGTGQVNVTDCGFSNVGTLFHARGGRPWINVDHCSAFLRSGPAFRVDGDTSPMIRVALSLFSTPQGTERRGDELEALPVAAWNAADRGRVSHNREDKR